MLQLLRMPSILNRTQGLESVNEITKNNFSCLDDRTFDDLIRTMGHLVVIKDESVRAVELSLLRKICEAPRVKGHMSAVKDIITYSIGNRVGRGFIPTLQKIIREVQGFWELLNMLLEEPMPAHESIAAKICLVMRSHPNCAYVQAWGARTLWELDVGDDHSVIQNDAVKAIVKAMNSLKSPVVQRQGCVALAKIAEMCTVEPTPQILDAWKAAMTLNKHCDITQRAGCKFADKVSLQGIAPLVVQALDVNEQDADTRGIACKVLAKLSACPEGRKQVRDCKGVASVLAAMRRKGGTPELWIEAINMLSQMNVDNDSSDEEWRLCAISAVLTALCHALEGGVLKAVMSAVKFLANATQTREGAQKLYSNNGINVLVKTLKKQGGHLGTAELTCLALARTINQCTVNFEVANTLQIVPTLMKAAQLHISDKMPCALYVISMMIQRDRRVLNGLPAKDFFAWAGDVIKRSRALEAMQIGVFHAAVTFISDTSDQELAFKQGLLDAVKEVIGKETRLKLTLCTSAVLVRRITEDRLDYAKAAFDCGLTELFKDKIMNLKVNAETSIQDIRRVIDNWKKFAPKKIHREVDELFPPTPTNALSTSVEDKASEELNDQAPASASDQAVDTSAQEEELTTLLARVKELQGLIGKRQGPEEEEAAGMLLKLSESTEKHKKKKRSMN